MDTVQPLKSRRHLHTVKLVGTDYIFKIFCIKLKFICENMKHSHLETLSIQIARCKDRSRERLYCILNKVAMARLKSARYSL